MDSALVHTNYLSNKSPKMKQEENYINIFSEHNAIKLNVNNINKNNERSLGQNSNLIHRLVDKQSRVWIIIPSFTTV